MAELDLDPEGRPIETVTLWLDYPRQEGAVTLDLTAFRAALAAVTAAVEQGDPQ